MAVVFAAITVVVRLVVVRGGPTGAAAVDEGRGRGGGDAFEVGTAPAGSAELERLIAAARSEADALAGAGGWAAVRVGFGDAETIDCETGRTVYVAG